MWLGLGEDLLCLVKLRHKTRLVRLRKCLISNGRQNALCLCESHVCDPLDPDLTCLQYCHFLASESTLCYVDSSSCLILTRLA